MVRKMLTWLVIAFVAFYLLSQPTAAAAAVKNAGSGLQHGATQVGKFLSSLTSN